MVEFDTKMSWWHRTRLSTDDGYKSFMCDSKYFDILHIDLEMVYEVRRWDATND